MRYTKKSCKLLNITASVVPLQLIMAFLFAIAVVMATDNCNAQNVSIKADPSHIQISAFYDGTSIKATGTIPAGTDIVVRITGEGEEIHLKKKGKVGGLLWMNTGAITFKNIPAVFMVYTTPEMAKMENLNEMLGYFSVKDKVEIEPVDEAKEFLFKEFTKLKEEEGVYIIDTKSVKYNGTSNGERQFEIDINVPPKMKPGEYSVEAYALSGSNIVGKADTELIISLIGFPAWISGLAFGHELLYGIMAVVVAVVAGLVTGMIFKDKGGAH